MHFRSSIKANRLCLPFVLFSLVTFLVFALWVVLLDQTVPVFWSLGSQMGYHFISGILLFVVAFRAASFQSVWKGFWKRKNMFSLEMYFKKEDKLSKLRTNCKKEKYWFRLQLSCCFCKLGLLLNRESSNWKSPHPGSLRSIRISLILPTQSVLNKCYDTAVMSFDAFLECESSLILQYQFYVKCEQTLNLTFVNIFRQEKVKIFFKSLSIKFYSETDHFLRLTKNLIDRNSFFECEFKET